MEVEIKNNLNGAFFTFCKRNCNISMWQWLKSVPSKHKSPKINFANHEAFLPHTPKNSKFILGSSSPELSRSLTFLSRHLSASLIKAQTQINPHFFSEKINSRLLFMIQSQKNNVILIKQTSRPKAIQRTPFGTARTEGKSLVRVKKLFR